MTSDELYDRNREWLPSALAVLCAHLPSEILQRFDEGEIDQCGEIGLMKASRSYKPVGAKPTATASFRTYAQRVIRNELISTIRQIVRRDARHFTNIFGPTFTHELMEDSPNEE